jgi:nucleoside-diphosphate-sugar epimerase
MMLGFDPGLQFVHEDDVVHALEHAAFHLARGAYNVAADGVLSTADVAREFGLLPLPVPAGPVRAAARAFAALPFLPPAAEWVEAASHPAIMDASKARRVLGWAPRYTGLEALRDTLRAGSG